MGVGAGIDIGLRDREILFSLLARHLPRTTVWVYGSRVAGGSMPWSDLDMVVFSGAEQKHRISALKEAFEESNLSFRVDLLEWDSLPDSFKANIASVPAWEISAGDDGCLKLSVRPPGALSAVSQAKTSQPMAKTSP